MDTLTAVKFEESQIISIECNGEKQNYLIVLIHNCDIYVQDEDNVIQKMTLVSDYWMLNNETKLENNKVILLNTLEFIKKKKSPTPSTFYQWFVRAKKNLCYTEHILSYVHNTQIYSTKIAVKDIIKDLFISVGIKNWTIIDAYTLIYMNKENEYWFPSQKNFNVLCSSEGRLFNTNLNRLIKCEPSEYDIQHNLYFDSFIDGDRAKIHRIIIHALMPPDIILEKVNHINNDKYDNGMTNLEPSNSSHNALAAFHETGRDGIISVKQTDVSAPENMPIEYPSIKNAAISNGISTTALTSNLRRKGFYRVGNSLFEHCDLGQKTNDKTWLTKDEENDVNILYAPLLRYITESGDTHEFTKHEYFFSKYNGYAIKKKKDRYYYITSNVSSGYSEVILTDDKGVRVCIKLNRAVLIAHTNGNTGRSDFPFYNDLQVDHIDEDKLNNNLSNLRYTTNQENSRLSNGYKAIGIIELGKCQDKEHFMQALKCDTLNYDAVFSDADVAEIFLHCGKTHISNACSNNNLMFNYWWTYITDKVYQSSMKSIGAIRFIRGTTSSIEVMVYYPDENKYVKEEPFNSILDAEANLGLKKRSLQRMYDSCKRGERITTNNDGSFSMECYICFKIKTGMRCLYIKANRDVQIVKKVRFILRHNNLIAMSASQILNANKNFESQHPLKYGK